MCCKSVWSGISVFILVFTFNLGLVTFTNKIFVNDNKTKNVKVSCTLESSEEVFEDKMIEIPRENDSKINSQTTFFSPPKLRECIDRINELEKEKAFVRLWISHNETTTRKQIAAKEKTY
jgi:hypothetical protein